jgi:hypothetical protein
MALHDRIVLQADSIGTRAELNSVEFCPERASRFLKPSFQQIISDPPLTKFPFASLRMSGQTAKHGGKREI